MLKVKDLTIRAESFLVDSVSFEVAQESCHVILGPTGSGKTLILESLAGIRRIETGVFSLAGQDITHTVPERRNIAYLPQDLALFPTMTVKKNIAYSLRFKGMDKKERDLKVMSIANNLSINKLLDRNIHHLSGGEKQRVALARALVAGNSMMLLDEPLSSLHTSLRREIWYLMQEIRQAHRLTLLMVTHDLEEALFLGDTISIMDAGKQLQTGLKQDVFNFPQSMDAARIVGVENYFEAIVQQKEKDHLILYSPLFDTSFKVKQLSPAQTILDDGKVILGIRANSLVPAEPRQHEKTNNVVSFRVIHAYEKGNGITLLLKNEKNNNIKVIAELRKNRCNAAPGQEMKIFFPEDELMVFS